MPRKAIIHNRYLPSWLHRLFSGVFATALCAGIGAGIWGYFPNSLIASFIFRWAIYLSVPIGIVFALCNPKKFSLVEGLGGGDSYDGLTPKEK